MSTRSVTIILQERERFEAGADGRLFEAGYEDVELARFYRHCDGYPTGHGLQMAYSFENYGRRRTNRADWFQRYICGFAMGMGLDGTPFGEWGEPCIEFEEPGMEHGDIDFLYTVRMDADGDVMMAVYDIGMDVRYADAMAEAPIFSGTPDEYIAEFVKEA